MGDNTTSIFQDRSSLFFAGYLPIQEMDPFSSSASYYRTVEMGNGDDSGGGSEEGLDVPEEPAKAVPHRSASKRSRAAEVHNLSEKRRRSRINEKMKALQNLIPNSNKTDKASMLDEAIEYLKQLQLQVQMLLMRNGPTSHPMYSPSSLHPLHTCMNFGDNTSTMNLSELGFLNLNQDSTMNSSYDLTNQCTNTLRSVMLPTASISVPESPFVLEPFQLRVPQQEAFTEERVSHHQLDSARITTNLPDVMKTIEVASSLCYGAQASSSSSSVLSKDHPDDNAIFVQNQLLANGSFTKDHVNIVKSEAQGM